LQKISDREPPWPCLASEPCQNATTLLGSLMKGRTGPCPKEMGNKFRFNNLRAAQWWSLVLAPPVFGGFPMWVGKPTKGRQLGSCSRKPIPSQGEEPRGETQGLLETLGGPIKESPTTRGNCLPRKVPRTKGKKGPAF